MTFHLTWKRFSGEQGVQSFELEQEATAAAREVAGYALVHRDPAGSMTVFRNGEVLQGADAAEVMQEFIPRRVIEILVTRAEEPDTNIDPDDSTGSGWRPGTPQAFGWQAVEYTGSGPKARIRHLRGPAGAFSTPEAAEAAARGAMEGDPELAELPVTHIHT